MKNSLLILLITVVCFSTVKAQNLIHTDDWVAGETGRTDNYQNQGLDTQNSRINMVGPYGETIVVWQALADGDAGFNGGFSENGVLLDTNKSYRVSFWVRSNGNMNCQNYTGFTPYDSNDNLLQNFQTEDGDPISWPYFSAMDMPNDKWYLIVGHIRPNGAVDLGTSGIYDPLNGSESSIPPASYETMDYIFPTGYSQIKTRIRAFMYACGAGESMHIAMPRIEEINGQEWSLSALLYGEDGGSTGPGNQGGTLWSANGQDINYMSGKVGIGTTMPGNYELAVNGEIRAKEIKVETANWPDYVFTKNYKLLSLEEVQKHIDKNGHLPNIPSATEIETNGVELGEMNRLLLEKIEELTLYIIRQEERIKILESKN
ncbi:hypothetical protein SAMN04488009_2832 [Maribacter sedimenticola]|uniref:LamG domain-containing protein n=1 Tax=Maribacter sedimenticola TaxID=228956 RepID=A0ABY1SJC9_9FLAO|nr:hypothetical protein [Maribacter sedimenticola]SNR62861.1 hypothetical protein SAMN04488009_2832 [Maribacter sedimenticola]